MAQKKCALVSLMVFALLATIAGPAAAGHHEGGSADLAAMEKMLWKAWKKQDAEPFKKHLSDGNINIVPSGITIGKDKQISAFTDGTCAVASFELGEITTHDIAEGVYILTYEASQDAVCDGTKVPERIYASSVWIEKDGHWYNAMYHETAAAE